MGWALELDDHSVQHILSAGNKHCLTKSSLQLAEMAAFTMVIKATSFAYCIKAMHVKRFAVSAT